MKTIKQTATFLTWERKLKDSRAKAIIAARVFRVANGLLGDVEPVGQGVSELRIHLWARLPGLFPAARRPACSIAVRRRQR